MHGMSTPKDDQVAAVQALFNDTASGPVFVHCKRGADRTGMAIAVYGSRTIKALREAKSHGMSFFASAIQHYVMDYRPPVILATAGEDSALQADKRGIR
jgi:protein tyrosine phosphatase